MADSNVRISVSRTDTLDPKKQIAFNAAKGDFHRLDQIITLRCWSPVIWLNGIRKKQNFMSSQVIALDFDDGSMTLEDADQWAKNLHLSYMIATTKSHQKPKGEKAACDRFRLLLHAENCLSMDDFEHTMKVYCENLGADIACKDAGRFYYPSIRVTHRGAGETAKWIKCPEEDRLDVKIERQRKYLANHQRDIRFPNYIFTPLIEGVQNGSREKTVYVMGHYFARTGWSEDEAFNFFVEFRSPLLYGGGKAGSGIGEREIRHALRMAYRYVETETMAIRKDGTKGNTGSSEIQNP